MAFADHAAAEAAIVELQGRVQRVRKTADEVVNNSTTLQNDDHLSLTVAAGEVWYGQMTLLTSAPSTTADLKIAFGLPTGATVTFTAMGPRGSDASFPFLMSAYDALIGASSGTAMVVQNGATGSPALPLLVMFTVVVGGTGGTVNFQWAQNVATASDSTIRSGSYLVAQKG